MEKIKDIPMESATVRPGDFPVGSKESRAAARFLAESKIRRNATFLIHYVPRPGGVPFNSCDENGRPCNIVKIGGQE
jgi:hypothetical protein